MSSGLPDFPQTIPPDTLLGRTGINAGPVQALPFSTLASIFPAPPPAFPLPPPGINATGFGFVGDGATDNIANNALVNLTAAINIAGLGYPGANLQNSTIFGAVTITAGTPTVVTTQNNHGLQANDAFIFTGSVGAVLPTGLTFNTPYFVKGLGLTPITFQFSTRNNNSFQTEGPAVSSTGAATGTISIQLINADWVTVVFPPGVYRYLSGANGCHVAGNRKLKISAYGASFPDGGFISNRSGVLNYALENWTFGIPFSLINTFSQTGSPANTNNGNITNISLTTLGTGYTSGTNVALTGGSGGGATVDITAVSGLVTVCTLHNMGAGFNVGNVLTISGGGGNATVTVNGTIGGTIITTTTPAGAVGFSTNQWICVAGLDMFANNGYPPGNREFQYMRLGYVNTVSGQMVLTDGGPLINNFRSSWPNFNRTTQSNNTQFAFTGGPACVMGMPANWDIDLIVEGLHLGGGGFTVCDVRTLTARDCVFVGQGFLPSNGKTFRFTNCTFGNSPELDKLVELVIYENCTIPGFTFGNSSVRQVIFDKCAIGLMLGTQRRNVIRDCSFYDLTIGSVYGMTDSIELTGTRCQNFGGQSAFGSGSNAGGFGMGNGGFKNGFAGYYSFSGGTLTLPGFLGTPGFGQPSTFCSLAFPGNKMYFWPWGASGRISFLIITNAGSGYTNGTHTNTALTGGSGVNATADIIVSGGVITSCVINFPGYGYHFNDTLSATAGMGAGSNFQVQVKGTDGGGDNLGSPFVVYDAYQDANGNYKLDTSLAALPAIQSSPSPQTATISAATPAVVNWGSPHNLVSGTPLLFFTSEPTGAPHGLDLPLVNGFPNTGYFVSATGLAANTFQISTQPDGSGTSVATTASTNTISAIIASISTTGVPSTPKLFLNRTGFTFSGDNSPTAFDVPQGSNIVVAIYAQSANVDISGFVPTDSAGNTYVLVQASVAAAGIQSCALYACFNCNFLPGGGVVRFAPGIGWIVTGWYFTGASAAVDQKTRQNITATALTTAINLSVTTVSTNEVIFVAFQCSQNMYGYAEPSPWTNNWQEPQYNTGSDGAFRVVSGAGTYTYNPASSRYVLVLANPVSLSSHPCPKLTANGNVGPANLEDLNGAIDEPIYSRAKRVISGFGNTTGGSGQMYVWGTLTSLTVNVVKAYSGGGTGTLTFYGVGWNQTSFAASDMAIVIDVATAGTRTITATSASGSTGADFNVVAYAAWLASGISIVPGGTWVSSSPSGTLAQQPIIEINVLTDQGVHRYDAWSVIDTETQSVPGIGIAPKNIDGTTTLGAEAG